MLLIRMHFYVICRIYKESSFIEFFDWLLDDTVRQNEKQIVVFSPFADHFEPLLELALVVEVAIKAFLLPVV